MIIFVGDKPSKRTDPNVPFKGAACEKRLKAWIAFVVCGKEFKIINRISPEFDIYMEMYGNTKGDKIIALGNEAAKALMKKGISHFKLPHPSYRNRQLNDTAVIKIHLDRCFRYIHWSQLWWEKVW